MGRGDGFGFRIQGLLTCARGLIRGFPKIRGYLFGDPYNKVYSILGSILGYPNFGKLPTEPLHLVEMISRTNLGESPVLYKARYLEFASNGC